MMKKLFFFTIILLAAITSNAANKTIKNDYYILQTSGNVGYSVSVNGVEVANSSGSFWGDINEWLTNGTNKAVVKVFDLENVEGGKREQNLTVTIKLYRPDGKETEPSAVKTLFEFSLNEDDTMFPLEYRNHFDIDFVKGLMLDRAQPLDVLTDGDKQAILEITGQLKQAILAKDSKKMYDLQKNKFADIAMARHRPQEASKRAIMEQLEILTSLTNISIEDTDKPYDFVIQNRLVMLVKEGEESSSTPKSSITINGAYEGEGTTILMELYFAKIDGNWTIIR